MSISRDTSENISSGNSVNAWPYCTVKTMNKLFRRRSYYARKIFATPHLYYANYGAICTKNGFSRCFLFKKLLCIFYKSNQEYVKRFHIENGLMCIVFSIQAFLSQIIALLYISQEIVYFLYI